MEQHHLHDLAESFPEEMDSLSMGTEAVVTRFKESGKLTVLAYELAERFALRAEEKVMLQAALGKVLEVDSTQRTSSLHQLLHSLNTRRLVLLVGS